MSKAIFDDFQGPNNSPANFPFGFKTGTAGSNINNIGIAGGQGFGVGICPGPLPAGMAKLQGTDDPASDNYGNYLYSDGSVMVWVPAFFYKYGTGANGLAINAVSIKSFADSGNTTVKGGFQFELSWQYALLMALHFGSVTSGAAVGGVFTEVLKIAKVGKSAWFEKGFTDLTTPQYFGYRGHRIAKYGYEKKGTGFVGCSFDIPGLKDVALATASYDTTPLDLGHAPFNAKGGSVMIDGVDVGTITSAKFDSDRIAKPTDPVIGGGGYSNQLPIGKATVKGSITTLFDSVTLYNKARSRAVVSVKLIDINGVGDGTVGNESIEHYFPETHLGRVDPTIKGDDGVMIDFPFTAFNKSDVGGSAMIVTIKHSSTVLHDLIALAVQ